ncbi:MAG: aminoacyl-tRNA hydrolase [Cyclobacteriaceae bacterium]|jgi:ribosome-associated protein|nr:aminoacyl-tRNA hydrolase [Cyclobacteriaceae bacterium]
MNLVTPSITEILPELIFVTSRSSGPGGQNVNKVNSKVTLKWDVATSVLSPEQKEVILKKLHSQVTKEGVLLISAQEARSQLQNKETVIRKLEELLVKAFARKKVRKITRPGKAAKQKRLQQKQRHAEKKRWRQRPE